MPEFPLDSDLIRLDDLLGGTATPPVHEAARLLFSCEPTRFPELLEVRTRVAQIHLLLADCLKPIAAHIADARLRQAALTEEAGE